ncbi:DUF2513 domain-containing protein [Cetobacterium somerae]|uniref:DUF2513 domain-containing protein n=1 Tax=Cetobacterium somerae TaxID=188913 RepID=UPI00211F45DE|nr:DUF2513 domain-containing protein [Cetobacterium somerae]MCQ9628413.1 DUF2513 domain-containing protein [Cetobacterium somerae]
MKLNANCTRDVMLILEKEVTPKYDIFIDNISFYNYIDDCSEEYTSEEFIYHLGQCIQEGLVIAISCNTQTSFGYQVRDLTPAGYKFLANNRDETIWEKTKKVFNEAPIKTIGVLFKISEAVAVNEISKFIANQSL